MARFDEKLLQGMKDDFDIVALIESYGTKLKDRPGTDGELIGLCPIHDDKSPSLVVNRKKNVWNCLGACGCGGDVIQWVMHAEKVGFRLAVERLRDNTVGRLASSKTGARTTHRLKSPIAATADDHGLLGHYHARLKESPDALAYLQKRLITDPEAIERFKLGFSDRTLGLRLPIKQVKDGADIRERLQTLGVLKESGHELLRDWQDHFSEPVGRRRGTGPMMERILRFELTSKQMKYLTQPSMPKDMLHGLNISGETVVEGNHDAVELLRERLTELLAKVGFDENYSPTDEGDLIERLIDLFYVP